MGEGEAKRLSKSVGIRRRKERTPGIATRGRDEENEAVEGDVHAGGKEGMVSATLEKGAKSGAGGDGVEKSDHRRAASRRRRRLACVCQRLAGHGRTGTRDQTPSRASLFAPSPIGGRADAGQRLGIATGFSATVSEASPGALSGFRAGCLPVRPGRCARSPFQHFAPAPHLDEEAHPPSIHHQTGRPSSTLGPRRNACCLPGPLR